MKVGKHSIAVASPDQVLYPAARFTKAAVVTYYLAVSRFILPHLKDRPMALKRYPNGIHGESFWEKDAPGFTPDWVKTTSVPRRDSAEPPIHYHPKLIVAEMAKHLRAGKVFIDWSQNADHKTTVAVYSLRAKRHRPYVSVPVTWKELTRALDRKNPDALYFLPPSAIERLDALGDPFSPVLALKQHLPAPFVASMAQSRHSGARPRKSLEAYAEKGKACFTST